MSVRENLRSFRRPLLFVGLSLLPIVLYLTRGPTYMQYFAMFWLGETARRQE